MTTQKAEKIDGQIVRRDPFDELLGDWGLGRGRWPARLFRMLDEPMLMRGDWLPAMDVIEEENATIVRTELPGIEPDKVEVRVEEGVLVIEGERDRETVDGKGAARRRERRWGKFFRSITLPEGADAEKIDAEFDKGVLTVRIPTPQTKPAKTGKKITVKAKA